jgi:hypothetical protein
MKGVFWGPEYMVVIAVTVLINPSIPIFLFSYNISGKFVSSTAYNVGYRL